MAALPIWLQLFLLGTIVNAVFSTGDLICACLADRVTTVLRSSQSVARLTRWTGGTILAGLGLNLALARQ